MIRESRPDGLFRYFGEHGYSVTNPCRGIYYIEGKVLFPTQIIVTKELEPGSHVWLKALSERLGKDDIRDLLDGIKQLTGKMDKEYADSVLEVSIGANKQIVEEMIGDENMCQALMEIMEPIMQQRDQENIEKWLKEGIQVMIDTLRELGHGDAEIKAVVMKKYDIAAEEVDRYL